MSPHLHQLCRTREDYRDLFIKQAREAGRLSLPVLQNTGPICVHRGEQLGTLTTPFGSLSVLQCSKHTETTLPQCESCLDRCEEAPRRTLGDILPSLGKGPRINKWAVGMVTAPRKEETFTQSMRSLLAAGWNSPRIFAEPGSPIPEEFQHLPLTQRDEKLGAWPNYHLALCELLDRYPDADAYLVSQDDMIYASGDRNQSLRQYLESALWPEENTGFVSIYCSSAYHKENPGWYKREGNWRWGACAIIWPRESLVHFLSTKGIRWRLDGMNKGMRNVDTVMGKWKKKYGRSAWYCSPSFCQHIGDTSTLFPSNRANGRRAARSVVGDLL